MTGNEFEVRVCVCLCACLCVWRCGRDVESLRILSERGKRREEGRKEGGKTIHPQCTQIITKLRL